MAAPTAPGHGRADIAEQAAGATERTIGAWPEAPAPILPTWEEPDPTWREKDVADRLLDQRVVQVTAEWTTR